MGSGEKIAGVDHIAAMALKTFQSGGDVWFNFERKDEITI